MSLQYSQGRLVTKAKNKHVHDYERKVRFNEQMYSEDGGQNKNFVQRKRRKFIGYQCKCGKVSVVDFSVD